MTFDEFLPYVMPDLPGCPLPTLVNELGTVLDEFCRATLCWTEILDPVIMRAGVDVYDFGASGAVVHAVNSMHSNGNEMHVTDRKRLFRETPDWLTRTSTAPDKFIRLSTQEFQVVPKPQVDGAVVLVDAILIPRLPLTSLPDAVMRDHREAIVSGLKYRLMAQANKSWSDPVTASFQKTLHDTKVTDAVNLRMRGYTTGDVYVQPRRFGLPAR